MGRVRLDALLVDRGLVRDRSEAVQMIDAGRVLVNGSVAQKAARQVNTSEAVHVASPPARFVSRGGLKLDRALHVFGIDPTDRTAVDAGSATGGFTDCLLQAGVCASPVCLILSSLLASFRGCHIPSHHVVSCLVIVQMPLTPAHEFMILACDGIW